jgi:hypothetical protein
MDKVFDNICWCPNCGSISNKDWLRRPGIFGKLSYLKMNCGPLLRIISKTNGFWEMTTTKNNILSELLERQVYSKNFEKLVELAYRRVRSYFG